MKHVCQASRLTDGLGERSITKACSTQKRPTTDRQDTIFPRVVTFSQSISDQSLYDWQVIARYDLELFARHGAVP